VLLIEYAALPGTGSSGAQPFPRGVASEFLLARADHLLCEIQVAARFTRHIPLELARECVFDIAKEFLELSVVDAGLLSSFHSPSIDAGWWLRLMSSRAQIQH